MTFGSSMLAITLRFPLQRTHRLISMPKRSSRCA